MSIQLPARRPERPFILNVNSAFIGTAASASRCAAIGNSIREIHHMRKPFAIALATALLLAGGSAFAQYQQQNAQQPQQKMQGQQNMQMQQNAQGQQNTMQRAKAASAKKTKHHKMSSRRHHHRMATLKKRHRIAKAKSHHRLANSKRVQKIGTASVKSKSMQQARRPVRETTGTGTSSTPRTGQQPKSLAPNNNMNNSNSTK
jgi:hypothetical protein